ncbi:MAG: peptidoglycan DD-metalloendopeptidase family protein [Clostridia bacterium]|nr:peptidoglycan DD-metalloendopeptidase family protein [Clostridia bacterium]
MNLTLKKIVTIIVLVCFVGITLSSIIIPFIASAAPTQGQIDAVSKKKNEQQQKINEAKQKQQGFLDEKSSIEKKIDVAQSEIDDIQKDIDDALSRIAQKEEELALAEEKAENQYETMKLRLRTMYEDNSSSYISLLFSGENFSDVFSYVELIKQLLNYDNNMYDNLLATKTSIEDAKTAIELEKEKYEQNQEAVISKRNELKGLKSDLDSTISKLENDIEAYKKAYAEFERQEAALKAQISAAVKNSGSGGASYSGGKLAWPAPGYTTITSPYGYRIHPTLKVYKLHTGVDFAAPMNATVVAAEDGLVVTAQYNNAYGNYIVINHGNGLSTLYAHNTTLFVSAGQQVTRGQTIAKVGSTGFSTGPHCHFEVMINGSCTDPMAYLR